MSIFVTQANEATAEELKAQGAVSNAIKTAGVHSLAITKMFETDGGTWKSMTVQFENGDGETISYQGFFGVPKSTEAADVDKAKAQTDRTMSDIARIVKAAGFPDVKAVVGGASTLTDSKGRSITVFPKVNGKKLMGTTTTVIDGQKKDGQVMPDKVFVKQQLNTFKFLDKSGKDQMKRDCKDSFDKEAKSTIEIAYGYETNPKHIAKLAELTEKLAVQNIATEKPLAGMPSATPTAEPVTEPATATVTVEPVLNDDDI